MRHSIFLAVVLLCTSCQQKITTGDLDLLNGYWEIAQVRMANGETKTYTINTTVDYIEVTGTSGFRKKVYPNLDGTFDTSNDAEQFDLTEGPKGFEFHYKTELSEWVEQLTTLDENSFSVTNASHITYSYKRFEPINVQQ